MTSEGVTKVELHKQQLNTKPAGQGGELDKEDFQKAAQDAKESVSNTLHSAKEFVVGGSNDAENKMTEQTAQGSSGDNSLQSLSDDLISNELTNIHSQQDVSHGSAQASESAKGTANNARDQTASAVEYVEGQMKTKSDPKEDPEITDFKSAAADTAHDVKKSVKPDDSTASKDSKQKSVLESVSDAAAAVYNKIVPSAEAKEPSEARQHLHNAGDAASDAGKDIKTSAYELKEAVADSARDYGRKAQDRAQHYGQEARSVSPADQQVDDVKDDLDRYSTRARDKAEDTYREGKEKGRGVWGSIQDFFGGGKDRAQDASDYGRDRARAAQDRFNRGYENTPSGGDIRREGRAAWENAKDATVDTGRYLAGRGSAVASGDNRSADHNRNADFDRTNRAARETKQDAKDTYYNAKDTVKNGYYDAKGSVKDGYYDAKNSIKDSYRETKDDVKDTFNDAKDSITGSYRDTKDSIKDKYNETNRELSRNIDQAKQSWHDAMTPQSYFEAAWSKGEIPSNTEDILRSRGVYSVGDARLENQTDDAQAYAQGKVMRGEDFLRATEFGYGEENLGGDDLSDLRAASDGHGPYAKYN
ncbi:TPA: hypothetical protein ACH3X1_008392 [Trebouxia sp. C0004]